jgi:hypothetical protein
MPIGIPRAKQSNLGVVSAKIPKLGVMPHVGSSGGGKNPIKSVKKTKEIQPSYSAPLHKISASFEKMGVK